MRLRIDKRPIRIDERRLTLIVRGTLYHYSFVVRMVYQSCLNIYELICIDISLIKIFRLAWTIRLEIVTEFLKRINR